MSVHAMGVVWGSGPHYELLNIGNFSLLSHLVGGEGRL